MSESARRSYVLVVVAVFAVALVARLAPLYWSPLPATLDGFRYATLARETLAAGTVPWTVIDADELVFTNALALVSAVIGLRPLHAAQPMVAVVGAAAPLVGVALARRVGLGVGLDPRRLYLAAALTGFGLALEGLFSRRTGVPDEEAFGLLLVPVLALAAHRWLASGERTWGVTTGLVVLTLPPLHNMSSLVGVFTVTALSAIHAARAVDRPTLLRALSLPPLAWGTFVGYFELATRLGLRITYSGLIRPYPGLLLAWVVVLVLGAVWVRTRTERAGRASLLAVVGLGFLIVGVNAVTPLFPGTVPSPPAVASLIAVLVVPTAFAAVGLPSVREGTGVAVLALLFAPVVLTYYTLSAALTPEFFGAVLRIQGFAHLPAFILAGIGVVSLGVGRPTAGRVVRFGAVGLFVVSVLLTVPLGYVNLDTGSYPSTTFRSEFETAEFASTHLNGSYATDHTLSRVETYYLSEPTPLSTDPEGNGASLGPTLTWLTGGPGPPPDCPVLLQRSWTTTGAHLYPAQPGTLTEARFRAALERRHVVYAVSGHDPLWLSLPVGANATGC